ncbi:MAG TPA: Bax inhibitor-1/YccA family protein [Candidatus Kapabacteria bacterium]|nr:Bax inhibitor-1/YccA family protein [Candidatus Kapabacteria bacterium]
MAFEKSGNPALRRTTFSGFEPLAATDQAMTLHGTINKTAILLTITAITALLTFDRIGTVYSFQQVAPFLYTGALGGLVLCVVIVLKGTAAPYLAPVYAALEGLFLGSVTAVLEDRFNGIALQSLLATVGIFVVVMLLYRFEIIKPTERFRMIVVSATAGLALYYLLNFALSFGGIHLPLMHENGVYGILFSLFAIVIASMNLVLDFEFIRRGAEMRVPKYMEWYGAFSLLVTLVWLYVEILRLLARRRG